MSDVKWTPSQLEAIGARDTSLLVSASAGSGKTAVLVERIIRELLSEDAPVEISDIIVVTFTVAATAQLKRKLADAVKKKLAIDPTDKYLQKQLRNIQKAKIKTINSFCYDCVKENFASLGLSAGVRIADDIENSLVMSTVMEKCIDEFYEKGESLGIKDFSAFCENFSLLRDDSLGEILYDLYLKCYVEVLGVESLKVNVTALQKAAQNDPFESVWGNEINCRCKKVLEHMRALIRESEKLIMTSEVYDIYAPAIESDLLFVEDALNSLKGTYEEFRSFVNAYKFVGLKAVKSDDPLVKDIKDEFQKTRNKMKGFHKQLTSYTEASVEDIAYFTERTACLTEELYTFLSYFHKKATEEKRHRGILSFADCEVLTLQLLYDAQNDAPTSVAREFRERYSRVYIDEYQDVNAVQDKIFEMITGKNSGFIVGDIKQSIYRFRGAVPELFGSYRDRYTPYKAESIDALTDNTSKIFLQENFRSDKSVIDFSNMTAGRVMVKAESDINYCSQDDLVCAKAAEKDMHLPVTVAVLDRNEAKNEEAVYVADEIEKLVAGGASYGDIAILLRATASYLSVFTQEFEKRGIPVNCNLGGNYFDTPEVMLALCYLNAIDNPRRDIFLCGLLKSPVYSFTLSELEKIRRACPAQSFYDSILQYCKENEFEKGRYFIAELAELREYAKAASAHELIWKLLYDKGLMACVTRASKDTEGAANNLLYLYERARGFEVGDFKGCTAFLEYITRVAEKGGTIVSEKTEGGNGVSIMTVHASKGLEFPYCFVCYADRNLKSKDLQNKLYSHSKLGVAANICDENGLVLYDTFMMKAIGIRIEEEALEEEMRLLYVALTRAINKLYVVGHAKDAQKFVEEKLDVDYFNRIYMLSENTYLRWVLAMLSGNGDSTYELVLPSVDEGEEEVILEAEEEIAEKNVELDESVVELLKKRAEFSYKHNKLVNVPAKISVSALYPGVLDEEEEARQIREAAIKTPFFVTGEDTNKGAKKGNATHAFMQFCDFARVDTNGVAKELDHLVQKGFLPFDAKELVDISAISAFFASDTYKNICSAKKVFREKRFNVALPCKYFTEENLEAFGEETMLVQGVIDCFYYDLDGKIVLLDYKTDRVPAYMSEAQGIDMLIQRHKRQLYYYKLALERITGCEVKSCQIYSFALNRAIDV